MRDLKACRSARQFAGDFLIGVAVFLAVLALACFDHSPALSAPVFQVKTDSKDRQSHVSPENVTSGTLFVAPVTTPDAEGPTPVQVRHIESTIDITVNGTVAQVTVTQKFANNTGHSGRGIFAFPVPKGASIDTLSVQVGDRLINGRIVRQAEAERMLQAAKSAGRFLSLSAKPDTGVTSISIDRIDAGEDVSVRFEYTQSLQHRAGFTVLGFPLMRSVSSPNISRPRSASIASNPAPGRAGNIRHDSANISLHVRLNAGFTLGKVHSPTHAVSLRRTSDDAAVLQLAHARIATDRNFELAWRPQKADATQLAAFKETHGKGNHILVQLTAPDAAHVASTTAREIIFAIDTSGSMAGPSLDQLKTGLSAALKNLTPRDRFNLIHFNSQSERLFDEARPATPESLAAALSFVTGLEARGGTEPLPALDAALADNRKDRDQRIRQIVFVTDGEIAGATEFLSRIAQKRGRSRLIMVGIGPDISPAVMQRAAEIGRGKFVHISARNAVNTQLTALLATLKQPVITDLHVEWPNGVRVDSWPNPLPGLYARETLLISGALSALKGDLKISGKVGGEPWSKTFPLANAVNGKGISKFWARHKLASLQARRYAGQAQADVDSAIEAVALEHGLVSSQTMLIGRDVSLLRPGNQPLASEELPIELPAAWVDDGISRHTPAGAGHDLTRTGNGDTETAAPPLVTSSFTGLMPSQNGASEITSVVQKSSIRSTANGHESNAAASSQTWMLSIMAMVFALMTAMTLGLWRHLRRAVAPRRKGRHLP